MCLLPTENLVCPFWARWWHRPNLSLMIPRVNLNRRKTLSPLSPAVSCLKPKLRTEWSLPVSVFKQRNESMPVLSPFPHPAKARVIVLSFTNALFVSSGFPSQSSVWPHQTLTVPPILSVSSAGCKAQQVGLKTPLSCVSPSYTGLVHV